MSKEIGHKIKKIRDYNNLSQERFGRKIGLSGKSISAYETGRTEPPLKVLERISKEYNANILGVNISTRNEIREKFEFLKKELALIGELILTE